jgi:hypothetical protein
LTPVNSFSFFKRVRLTVVGEPHQGVRGSNGLFLAGASSGQSGTNFVVTFQGFGPKTVAKARA